MGLNTKHVLTDTYQALLLHSLSFLVPSTHFRFLGPTHPIKAPQPTWSLCRQAIQDMHEHIAKHPP